MPRADELEHGDRIRHPDLGAIVEVVRVRNMLSKTRVTFRAKGQHGSFDCNPHKEIEDCT
jgi:hypothetical protein